MDDENVEVLVRRQQRLHLNVGVRDVYKLMFQGVMGVAHILEDREQARRYLANEFAGVDVSEFLDEPLVEDVSVGDGVVRINLRPFKRFGLSLDRLFEVMVASAEKLKEDKERFIMLWKRFIELVKAGRLDFDYEALVEFDRTMRDKGYPPIHHSKEYVKTNKPAYRVMDKRVYQIMFG